MQISIRAGVSLALLLVMVASTVYAERVSVDEEHAKLKFDFDNGCMQGWHNRVWVTNGVGVGAWTDLTPNTYGFDEGLTPKPNNCLIYPAIAGEDINALFCSSTNWHPWARNERGSYLTIGDPHRATSYLDRGTNTKWVRSPKFRITGSGDLIFNIVWGKSEDAESAPASVNDVEPVALAEKGWAGVCLTDVETGRFILSQKGCAQSVWYTEYRFTAEQMANAGVTPDRFYTLDLMTMRAGAGSWIALDDVEIPGVLDDPDVGTLGYEFAENSMQGWRNRVWDTSADGGLGAWKDLSPDVDKLPSTVNGGAIFPETADTAGKVNSLFTSYCTTAYPNNMHRCGSYLITEQLNKGSNVKWVRSPEFFIDRASDIIFRMRWGNTETDAYLRDWESMVTNTAVSSAGWTGVALRDAETGRFVLKEKGTRDGTFVKHVFPAADIAKLDLNRAYTLDMITMRAGYGSWIALDNVSIPGHLTSAYMTSFSLGSLGSATRISGEIEFTVPMTTDVTKLAPTFTLGDDATCDYASGAVRDFTTPQTYTVTLADGTWRKFRVTVNKARDMLTVKDGLVYRLRADMGVICDDDGNILKWKPCVGSSGHLTAAVPTNPPTYAAVSTRNRRPSIHFAGPCKDGGTSGQGLLGCATEGMPAGVKARTVFLCGRYNYSAQPESHGWGGFAYGATPKANDSGKTPDNGSIFGLVATASNFLSGRLQTLAIQGWGSGFDFGNDTSEVGNKWFTQCVTATPDANGKLDLRHYLNGVLQKTHFGVSYSTGRSLVAVACSANESSFQLMDVCEVLIYDRVLSASEQSEVEAYINTQWSASGLVFIAR